MPSMSFLLTGRDALSDVFDDVGDAATRMARRLHAASMDADRNVRTFTRNTSTRMAGLRRDTDAAWQGPRGTRQGHQAARSCCDPGSSFAGADRGRGRHGRRGHAGDDRSARPADRRALGRSRGGEEVRGRGRQERRPVSGGGRRPHRLCGVGVQAAAGDAGSGGSARPAEGLLPGVVRLSGWRHGADGHQGHRDPQQPAAQDHRAGQGHGRRDRPVHDHHRRGDGLPGPGPPQQQVHHLRAEDTAQRERRVRASAPGQRQW